MDQSQQRVFRPVSVDQLCPRGNKKRSPPPTSQALLLHCTVPGLSLGQFLADANDCVVNPTYLLGQNGAHSCVQVSVCRKKGREKLVVWSRGSQQKTFFSCMNSAWHCSVHWTSSGALCWVRLVKGLVSSVKRGRELAILTSQPQEPPLFWSYAI